MGLFDTIFGSSKSKFEREMEDVARQLMLALGKIQEGMRCYLLKYISANSMPLNNQVVEHTFTWLISGIPPPDKDMALARQYAEALKTSPIVCKTFATAMAFKINLMTSRGLMSEAMQIVKNLNTLRFSVFSIDLQLPNERAFIAMADDFYNSSRDMVPPAVDALESGIPALNTERYELRAEIGRGGFGVVHLAFDKKLQREVAIKRLLVDRNAVLQAEFIRRFEREARIIASLNHPHIVQIFDFETSAQGYSIIMEYVRGGSLSALLAKSGDSLSIDMTCELVLQICAGLAHAHSKGIIHRDLKPQNILIDHDGSQLRAKIADFGIARGGVQADSINTRGGMGTPLYMSPEQRTDASNVTKATDIYSLGKMLLEMLTGEIGYEIDLVSTTLAAQWKSVVEKCTHRNPALRYADAQELRLALLALQERKAI